MKPLLIEVTPFAVSLQTLNESRDKVSGNPLVEGILATCEVKNGNRKGGLYMPSPGNDPGNIDESKLRSVIKSMIKETLK